MNKLAELRQKLADLKSEGQTLLKSIEDEDRDPTETENARLDEIEAEMEDTQEAIAKAEASAERRRRMDAVTVSGQDGERGQRSPAGATTVHDRDPRLTGGFRDIGEFAVAVHGAVQATRFGGNIDSRLRPFAAPTNSHQGGGGSGEGYSLPPAMRDEVWDLVTEFDEFGSVIDEEPTGRREVKMGADETTPWGTSGIKAYWRAEGTQMTATQLADEGRNVPLHELYTLVTATEELLDDAVRLNNRLTRKAAMAIAWKKNLAIVDGSGSGQPLGWINSPALITVTKESGQTNATIVAANVLKMITRLQMVPGDRAFWLAHQDTIPQLATMTIGDKPVWMPPNGLADAPGGFLMGKPVRFSEFAETLGQAGDLQLISPKGYYGARHASGLQFASSIHLYFDYNTEAFRWVFRYGGQPHLSAPISPAKGSTTRSHFVRLGARTG